MIYICVLYIHIFKDRPFRSLLICQWPDGNSCTWVHGVLHESILNLKNKAFTSKRQKQNVFSDANFFPHLD